MRLFRTTEAEFATATNTNSLSTLVSQMARQNYIKYKRTALTAATEHKHLPP